MKTILVLAFICLSTSIYAQDKPVKESKPDPERKLYVLDASCGQCQFKLQGKGCDLAVKFEEAWKMFKEKKYSAEWYVNGIGLLRHNSKFWDLVATTAFS